MSKIWRTFLKKCEVGSLIRELPRLRIKDKQFGVVKLFFINPNFSCKNFPDVIIALG